MEGCIRKCKMTYILPAIIGSYIIAQMEAEQISLEERKRLDRQRFIGWETQKKLLSSRVLIAPANGPNTELAKNLILAGVNVTIYDDATVTQDDFESNFLVADKDIGKSRAEAVYSRLKEMNPSGKNEVFLENLLDNVDQYPDDKFKAYSFIATSTTNFDVAAKWDTLSKRLNVPYYNLVCCGLFSFAFISLGSMYEYNVIDKKTNKIDIEWGISSFSLQQALDYKNAEKHKEFIAAIQMMQETQKQGVVYDPFNPDESTLEKIVNVGIEKIGEKHREFITTFAKTYGLDFCPTYSVIGSIISQEVIKIAEHQTEPGMNWLIFNSEQNYGSIVKLSTQKSKITRTVHAKEMI